MNINDILNENILYYPSIEFESVSWVKAALCIWEKIYRIVPENIVPNDPPEIRMAVEEGIIKNLVLEKKDISQASDEFMNFVGNLPWLPDGLDGSEDEIINLHKDKVDASLYPFLKELAFKVDGDWLKLTPEIAHGYMLFLADSVSKRRALPKITDDKRIFSIMAYFEEEGNFDEWVYSSEREEYYTSVIFPTLLPGGVTRVDIENVLSFREETRKIRQGFRTSVEQFSLELQKIESKDYALEIGYQLKQQLDSQKKSILEIAKERAINLIPSILAIGVPTTFTAMSVLGPGDPFALRNVMNSACIGAISSIADASNRKIWTPDAASYYLKLNSRFSDGEKFVLNEPKFHKVFEEFMND